MKSVPFSEREKKSAGVLGTADVFGPYSGGRDVDDLVGDKKRHLSLQLSQRNGPPEDTGSTGRMNGLDV